MCLHIYAQRWIPMLQWQVDYTRRSLVAKNHTATHILNYALRQVLGEKVDQKGSLVTEDKLRFDFSHGKPVELKELKKIEEICNQMIQKSCVIHFRDVALDTAKAITGLRDLAQRVIVSPWRLPKPPPPLLRGLWMLVGEGVVGNEEWGVHGQHMLKCWHPRGGVWWDLSWPRPCGQRWPEDWWSPHG